MNNTEFDGRLIRVDHAQDNRPGGGGRGGGFGGRGGYTMPAATQGGYAQPGTQMRDPATMGYGRGVAYAPSWGQYNGQYQQQGGPYGGNQPQGGNDPYGPQGPYRQ
ncbi:hypothetical protein A1O1_05240 [Capronia coronata CBS 617.96]|uniref:RRM domain-containing protein n=1 Tax=Capronia coronata CBS 617.96 TaxID=1182541 RepID=W9YF58_9EURO|nr:uncharacterized protein A1O1_05240 [Capronia coronata CBS 617.96]EXJ88310.1 hypothetical protein A1O1_05240 [Capronia coronata CBS 617.96]